MSNTINDSRRARLARTKYTPRKKPPLKKIKQLKKSR